MPDIYGFEIYHLSLLIWVLVFAKLVVWRRIQETLEVLNA